MPKKMRPKFHCRLCGHDWTGLTQNEPRRCPKCHQPEWARPSLTLDQHWDRVGNSFIDFQISELREVIKLIEGRIAGLEAKKKSS
jgi:hypothetical protein